MAVRDVLDGLSGQDSTSNSQKQESCEDANGIRTCVCEGLAAPLSDWKIRLMYVFTLTDCLRLHEHASSRVVLILGNPRGSSHHQGRVLCFRQTTIYPDRSLCSVVISLLQ